MTQQMLKFTPEIIPKLKYYVYMLTDPRHNDKPFYVGKGKDNRVFAHVLNVKGELPIDDTAQDNPTTLDKIRKIRADGKEVGHKIIRYGLDNEYDALEIESILISTIPDLTNKVAGHHSEYTCKSVKEIAKLLGNPIDEFEHNVILIKVYPRTIEERGSVYDAVRWCWKINPNNCTNPYYVLAVVEGVVEGVFEEIQWQEANATNLKQDAKLTSLGIKPPENKRWFFTGTRVEGSQYQGKLIPEEYRSRARNPIRYSDCTHYAKPIALTDI